MRFAAIIFDFDGVIADSEVHANLALAECLSLIGLPTTFEDCMRDYYGYNWEESRRVIEEKLGRGVPQGFRQMCRDREDDMVGEGSRAITGIEGLLNELAGTPLAIASSSPTKSILSSLRRYGIEHHFADHIYSADGWARGKPYPDIYLAAALGLGVDPIDCLVIEDSAVGATAAVAAGMSVVGFCGGSHIFETAKHAKTLRSVGVRTIVSSHSEIGLLLLEPPYSL